MSLSPSDVEFLIHCQCSPAIHPRSHAPAIQDAIKRFLDMGLIYEDQELKGRFRTTELGSLVIERMCRPKVPDLSLIKRLMAAAVEFWMAGKEDRDMCLYVENQAIEEIRECIKQLYSVDLDDEQIGMLLGRRNDY